MATLVAGHLARALARLLPEGDPRYMRLITGDPLDPDRDLCAACGNQLPPGTRCPACAEVTPEVTPAMIDAALGVLREEWTPPYMARAADYLPPQCAIHWPVVWVASCADCVRYNAQTGEELARLQAADQEADLLNRDLVRRAIAAALGA
jgi:hypothetical protein